MFRAKLVPVLAFCAFLVAGCATTMKEQPKYLPLSYSEFYSDHQSARPLVPNTVARGFAGGDQLLLTGMVNGQPADMFPFPLTAADLQRGQALFNGICAPCHDRAGTGDGVVVERGFTPPPTFHSDRLRSAPPGHFFDVITNGFGAMPDYGPIIQVPDRWRIVGYIRALQLSQNATLADVPPNLRDQLGTGPALPTPAPTAAGSAPATGGTPASDVAQGQQLFTSQGCSGCHLTNGSGPGPSLEGVFGKQAQIQGGQTVTADEAYIRESIFDPTARIVQGYQPIMPSFQGRLTDQQVNQLIAYIKSLSSQ